MKQDNDEPTKCKNCGNLYTHKKNCMNKKTELNPTNREPERDPRLDDPEIREILNTEALDQ